jgi:hypothetical protein
VDSNYLRSQEKNTKHKLNRFNHPVKAKVKHTGEGLLFQTLFQIRHHVSFITGEPIPDISHYNCHHVLSKSAFSQFRLLDRNIVFLSREEHDTYHASGWSYLVTLHPGWVKLKMLYEELKQEYYKKSRREPA